MIKRNWKVLAAVLLVVVACFTFNRAVTTPTILTSDDPRIVITLGQDLTQQQRQEMLAFFSTWHKDKPVDFLLVSNQEERRYLSSLVDESLIGTKAISCAYCELLGQGKGIEVKTSNIEGITPFMYANALATAGIEDARVIVAAPVKVSGTAALTGIIKAFENARGKVLSEDAKSTAYQELARTRELGQKIGQRNAETIIYEVKKQVLAKRAETPDEIRQIIIDASETLHVKLSEDDIQMLVQLMEKIRQLNLSMNQLGGQLQNLHRDLGEVKGIGNLIKDALQTIVQMIRQGLASITR